MKIMRVLPLVLMSTALVLSAAADAVENDRRWYLSGMISGIDSDKDRGADDDFGGYQVSLGRNPGEGWPAVEATVVGGTFEERGTTLAHQWGLGLDFVFDFLEPEYFQPYYVLGAGYLVTDKKLGLEDESGPMLNAGAGLRFPIFWGLQLRTDFRARWDYGGPGHLTDYIWNIGINIPLSAQVRDVRAYEGFPATTGEEPAPRYRYVPDTDNDGLVDPEDRCPNTRGGAVVNEFGCAPSDDSDGDNVPDSDDMCGGTPAGEAVDEYGCRITPPAELSVPAGEE